MEHSSSVPNESMPPRSTMPRNSHASRGEIQRTMRLTMICVLAGLVFAALVTILLVKVL